MLLTSLRKLLSGRAAVSAAALPPDPEAPEPEPEPEPAAPAGPFEGYVDELSPMHASGWLRDLGRPGERVAYEIVLPESGEVLARGVADQFRHGLAAAGIGDGCHAFWNRFGRMLSEAERDLAAVRVTANGQSAIRSPNGSRAYEPLLHVAMDIVDNCNLRCPFCLYDYEHTKATHFMTPETLEAALRFVPYARDGEFWFSCLHEPTLHPQLIAFVERVAPQYRRKLFFTTNLAKRMPADYFDWLAGNGMHHINISIESRDPALYERMRKGARHRIFQENWDVLMGALSRAARPTPIRYIAMAYKSNLRELPGLARHLLEERRASQVEIRYTYDVAHLPPDFRAAEFLDAADWAWLAAELAGYTPQQVLLLPEPPAAPINDPITDPITDRGADPGAMPADAAGPPPVPGVLPGRVMFRLSWNGTLKVVGVSTASRHDDAIETVMLETNIRDIEEPEAFFAALLAQTESAAATA